MNSVDVGSGQAALRTPIPLICGFVLLACMIVGAAWLSLVQDRADARLRQSVDASSEILLLFSALQDTETSQRGYLLTGDEHYLVPYQTATAGLEPRLERIAAAFARNPLNVSDLKELRVVLAEKLSELRKTIALRRAGQSEKSIEIVQAGSGKALMDRARLLVGAIEQRTREEIFEQRRNAARVTKLSQAGIALAGLVIVVLAVFAITDARRRNGNLTQAISVVRQTHDALVQANIGRDKLEAALRQAQKMDAMGQLTGGLAHDFNNMLAIIIGNLNILKRRLDRGDRNVERYADQALEGASRAATLTHRLLAFSRNQPLSPETIEPNRLVSGMSDMLRRTIGETIQIETVLAAGLWRTHIDAHQLENALLNLAINARDAMPDGGRLTIETSNADIDDRYASENPGVASGQYVMIAVTDTGTGMTPEVSAKAFDPFFTTKAVGQGTGLGLSQVFGFTRQSNGNVKIYSEPGQGTSVKIYLPRAVGANATVLASNRNASRYAEGVVDERLAGSTAEVILVVEDEPAVRRLTVEALRELNYTVIHAEGGVAALRLLDQHPDVTLLFTDVVMPEMNGRQLAEAACGRRPSLKVLYTSGYTRNAIIHNGVVDADVKLIGKPFTVENLARKVREAIAA